MASIRASPRAFVFAIAKRENTARSVFLCHLHLCRPPALDFFIIFIIEWYMFNIDITGPCKISEAHCSLFRCCNVVWPEQPIRFEMTNQNRVLSQISVVSKKQVSGDHSNVILVFLSLQGKQQYMQQWPWPVHQWWGETRYSKDTGNYKVQQFNLLMWLKLVSDLILGIWSSKVRHSWIVWRKMTSSQPDQLWGNAGAREGGFDTMGWLLGTQATLIRRCHVVLMSAEAFANLISCGGARRPLI